ncbi:MAG: NAD(P)-dependent oxidoreductase [Deltaproteobacteria bacterium]|nr:NAD(P)-dependent oxidoreductase [Deltaproteobacteria bacterium]
MKIIITGATGFIGRNVAESFNEEGINVVATGRSQDIGEKLRKTGIDFIPANLKNRSQLKKAFAPADYVIHCAAKAGDWGKYKEFYETNVLGTRNVIDACKRNDIGKIIFISSPSAYFTGKDRHNILESEPLPKKQFKYGKTKLISENELLAQKKEGLKTIILRPRAVYGKYDNIIVPRILKLSEKKNLPLINGGQALTDITYVDNFVSAIKNCFSAPDDAWNEVYNISNGDPISIKDWFSQVLEIFERPFNPKNLPVPIAKIFAGIMETMSILPFGNKEPALTRFSVGYMAKTMTMSIAKAKRKLNYLPKIGNREGFENYKKWYNNLYGN